MTRRHVFGTAQPSPRRRIRARARREPDRIVVDHQGKTITGRVTMPPEPSTACPHQLLVGDGKDHPREPAPCTLEGRHAGEHTEAGGRTWR